MTQENITWQLTARLEMLAGKGPEFFGEFQALVERYGAKMGSEIKRVEEGERQ